MPARKMIYRINDVVYICGNHHLAGKKGLIVERKKPLGNYIVKIENEKWLVRGIQLRINPLKKNVEF